MLIQDIRLRVLYNGRGDPGIEADVLVDGKLGRALSPSGASKGAHEAASFPDDKPEGSVSAFRSFKRRLVGQDAADIPAMTDLLRKIDGTENFSRIGGSLAYAVSVAAAEAEANARGVPLCRVIDPRCSLLPYPLGNVLGGGKHASDLSPSIQEILVSAVGAKNVREAVELDLAVHKNVGKRLSKALPYPVGKSDEGGWSPGITDEEALRTVKEAADEVADRSGRNIRVGMDVAADSLHDEKKGGYYYRSTKKTLRREDQVSFIGELRDRYDLFYIEDPLEEEDFDGYAELHASLKGTLVVGDDLYVTDTSRLRTGIKKGSTNAVIVKVNQVGTLGQAREFSALARKDGQVPAASHRSGDNEGGHLAHFGVGLRCGMIKCGIVGGERTSKLNELIRLAESLGGRFGTLGV